jgi:DsbC/DsbD-like thiol-disulfide interchange protein/cytochrome c biogenesis protein CcdA
MTDFSAAWIRVGRQLMLGLVLAWLGHAGAQNATVSTPQIRAELVAHAPNGVQAGQAIWVGLSLEHAPQWHTYWINPGDSGLPTQLEWNLPPGVRAEPVLWPLPHQLRAGTLTNYGFEGNALLVVPLHIAKDFKPSAKNTLDIQLHANWLVCRLECIPQEGDFSLSIPTHSSTATQTAAFESVLAQQPQALVNLQAIAHPQGAGNAQFLTLEIRGLPANLQGRRLEVFALEPEILDSASHNHPQASQAWAGDVWQAQLPLSNLRSAAPAALTLLLVDASQGTRQGWRVGLKIEGAWPDPSQEPLPSASVDITPTDFSAADNTSFVLALLGACLGGLILNLMPCVLPVLAIKFLGFSRQHAHAREQRLSGLAYTLGVVMSFLALGAALLALRAAGEQLGWGFQLQSPGVVALLAGLFTLIALNLFGLFELGQVLPSASNHQRVGVGRAGGGGGFTLYSAIHGSVAGVGNDFAHLASAGHFHVHGIGFGAALFVAELASQFGTSHAPTRRLDGDIAPAAGLSDVGHRGVVGLGFESANQQRCQRFGVAGLAHAFGLGLVASLQKPCGSLVSSGVARCTVDLRHAGVARF